MTQVDHFVELLERARSGDAAALDEIARTYERDLRIAARVHLGPALRPYLDSLDLVQSVHRSLMLGLRNDKFDIATPERLIALALTMVRRKIARQWRRHRKQTRTDALVETAEESSIDDIESRDALETVWSLASEEDRSFLELMKSGHSIVDAGRVLGIPAATLRTRFHRLRLRLARPAQEQ